MMAEAHVYHEGELAVQRRTGEEAAARQNGRTIRNELPAGAVRLFQDQTFAIVSSTDKLGKVWCSCITGEPGFIRVIDAQTIQLTAGPVEGDPFLPNVKLQPEIGILVIDLLKKRRVRMNGQGMLDANHHLIVKVEQAYGNCPKYIQKRTCEEGSSMLRLPGISTRERFLSGAQREWIRNADTFFIGSAHASGKADASHRGGSPGFVQMEDERVLIFPDYVGNSMYNTLGNIHTNPQTGLLFMDFTNGHTLQLTGRSAIIWDQEAEALIPSAERLVRFELEEVLFTQNLTKIRWESV
ncbi:pyridoxamine 5'-phosphate oxidase family protein [Paenibacillus sp. 1P07SE]|uniref:pyridoxamine 5'-phosphate oxidase family protein n=1 Tax=Paenibacillus sp. 1P07SE TaxID=3132209 RepID=UPI0039A4511D